MCVNRAYKRTSDTLDVTITTIDTLSNSMSDVCFFDLSAKHVPLISGKYRAFCRQLARLLPTYICTDHCLWAAPCLATMRSNLMKIVEVATRGFLNTAGEHVSTYIRRRFSRRTSRSNHSAWRSDQERLCDVGRLDTPSACERNGSGCAFASVAASDTDDVYDEGSGAPNDNFLSFSLGDFVLYARVYTAVRTAQPGRARHAVRVASVGSI